MSSSRATSSHPIVAPHDTPITQIHVFPCFRGPKCRVGLLCPDFWPFPRTKGVFGLVRPGFWPFFQTGVTYVTSKRGDLRHG